MTDAEWKAVLDEVEMLRKRYAGSGITLSDAVIADRDEDPEDEHEGHYSGCPRRGVDDFAAMWSPCKCGREE